MAEVVQQECHTRLRDMIVPLSECYKHCSLLKAPHLLPTESKQRAKKQASERHLIADDRDK